MVVHKGKMACVFRVFRPVLNINLTSTPIKTVRCHGLLSKRSVRSLSSFSKWSANEKCCLKSRGVELEVTKAAFTRTFCADKKLTLEDVSERVLKVCNTYDKIQPNQATLDAHFMNDLGLDSLDHVELIMNMEDEFNIEIADSDAEKMLRPRDVVNFLVMKLQPEGCLQ